MRAAEVRAWFDDYLRDFAALGRGEQDDPRILLVYYAVPLLLTSDEAVLYPADEGEVVEVIDRQIAGMRAAGYDHSMLLSSELSFLNARTAVYGAEFSRRRSDDTEIGRLAATYLLTAGEQGRRISALIVRT
jgi:hypothetical protein